MSIDGRHFAVHSDVCHKWDFSRQHNHRVDKYISGLLMESIAAGQEKFPMSRESWSRFFLLPRLFLSLSEKFRSR
jgi:hypothetical protein